ncbi:MAG TPA: ribosome silencing factor [Bacillota bacterium]|nr:ribosome silencing factor [Bacillota bacterium]HOP69922.1 ribosome silencing factor [Bacillota bacterium]HPT34091.1 ribosome silencing factor [Bacillota bacterium]HPZ64754.1 ribosome silencing factor [Bacillota bacterium]HQD06977.1 ribosome silencing factor [Bacillota bacterium]
MSREESSRELVELAARLAAEKKGEDLLALHIGKISIVADYFLLVSGASAVQVRSICDHLLEKIKEAGYSRLSLQGYEEGWWVVIDYGSVVIHVFQREARAFYNLERLWSAAPLVELSGGEAAGGR